MSIARLTTALADRYRIERELGQGGMATVYLAEDLKHKRRVAIKVLKPELAAVLGAERFVQEITTTAALQHPHILPLFDSGEADGFLFYVMPFIDGETLRTKLDRETQLGVDEAVRIASDVASALHYAHTNGVIHRDIKPENILLHDGRPMVADFGIALAVSAAAGGRMTETGLSLGTPHYMSPEQATAEKEITGRSDVYSLGSVLYEMLAGDPPHTGSSAQQIIMKIITEQPQVVTQLRKAVPSNVAEAVAKSLEKLPADRFESAKAFAEALANPAFSVSRNRTASGPLSHSVSARLPWVVAAAAVLTTALMALFSMQPPAATDARTPWLLDLNLPPQAEIRNGMALAPDGSVLLYGGPDGIWARRAGSTAPVRIAGTEGACCPALSPDGKQVAFLVGDELRVVPIGGGESRALGRGFRYGDDIAWTADGSIVGVSSTRGGLSRVSGTGGAVERFTHLDTLAGESDHWSPRALPDGRGVIFTVLPRDPTDSVGLRIAVVGPEGGEHTVLMAGRVAAFGAPGHLIVTRRNGDVVAVPFDSKARRLTGNPIPLFSVPHTPGTFTWRGYTTVASTGTLAYIAGEEAPREFFWVNRSGIPTLLRVDAPFTDGRASNAPSGDVIAFDSYIDLSQPVVEVRDLRSGASSRLAEPAGEIGDVTFTPDGLALVFRVRAPGRTGIFTARLGRLNEQTLLLADRSAIKPSLSADGETLYFVRTGGRTLEFVAQRLGEPKAPAQVLASGGTGADWEPQVSPDGRWLAFVETSVSGREVIVRSTDPTRTERWTVASASRESIQWAVNGRELFFIAQDSMRVAEVSTGPEFKVNRVRALFAIQDWFPRFTVAADGRFLVGRYTSGSSSWRLMLLDDWRALLPRP